MHRRRAMVSGLAAAALAACGTRRAAPVPAAPVPVGAAVRRARFGDARPHPWGGETPHDLPVHGIDVARWQSDIDWPTARAHGVNFAFVKATEGADGTHPNPEFTRQWHGARAAGVPRGAYHLYYWCAGPEEQARHFIAVVPREAGSLPPVLDLEWNPRSPTCRVKPAPAEVRRQVRRFSDLVAAHYGQRPILYVTVDFFDEAGMAALRGEEFWLRSVAAHPRERFGRTGWSFWQYSGTGLVPGVAGQVDLNAFHGSEAQWPGWLAARVVR